LWGKSIRRKYCTLRNDPSPFPLSLVKSNCAQPYWFPPMQGLSFPIQLHKLPDFSVDSNWVSTPATMGKLSYTWTVSTDLELASELPGGMHRKGRQGGLDIPPVHLESCSSWQQSHSIRKTTGSVKWVGGKWTEDERHSRSKSCSVLSRREFELYDVSAVCWEAPSRHEGQRLGGHLLQVREDDQMWCETRLGRMPLLPDKMAALLGVLIKL